MNHAGLPGTGLGGLFYLALAFWMPVAELPRTIQGRSSRERWRRVATQFALASGIVAAVAGSMLLVSRFADTASIGVSGPVLVVAPVLIASVMLSVLVLVLRTWAGWERFRAQG